MCELTMARVRGVMLRTASALIIMEVINALITWGPIYLYGVH